MPRHEPVSLVAFEALPAEVWDALPVPTLMHTRDWLEAALAAYAPEGRGWALLAGQASAPRGIAVFHRHGSAHGLRLTGGIDLGESVAVQALDDAARDAMAAALVRLGVPVELGHYPVADGFAQRLRQAQGLRGVTLTRALDTRAMPRLGLDPSWREPLAHCRSRRRQDLRRKRRKAEATGPVSFHALPAGPSEVEPLLARMMAVEAKSWKGREGTALAQDARQAGFFLDFGRRMAAMGRLRMCFLQIGEQDAAACYAVVWGGRFWAIKVGYDEAFSAVSPGALLVVEMLARAAAEGCTGFEFCGKEAPWTQSWTEEAEEIEALRFYPFTPAGLTGLASDSVRLVANRLRRGG